MEKSHGGLASGAAPVALAGFVVVFSVFLLVLATETPSSTLWDGYRVLCVSPADRENDVISILESAGIHEYVTQGNSKIIPSQSLCPVVSFLPEVEESRAKWFFDSRRTHRLVYIDENSAGAQYERSVCGLLDAAGFSWVLERNTVFVFAPVALLALFVAFAVCVCAAFPAVLCASVFPLLFAVSKNDFAGWLSAFFFLCGVTVFFEAVFPARVNTSVSQKKAMAKKNAVFFMPWFLASFCAAFSPGVRFLLVFLVPAGSAAFLFLLWKRFPAFFYTDSLFFLFKTRKRLHPVFRMEVMEIGGAAIPGAWGRTRAPGAPLFQLAWGAILIPASLFLFNVGGVSWGSDSPGGGPVDFFTEKPEKNGVYALYIPAPEMYTAGKGFSLDTYEQSISESCFFLGEGGGDSLFSLSDFLILQWNIAAYPWRRLGAAFEIPEAGSTIQSREFTEIRAGVLAPESKRKAEFNSDFIMDILENNASPLEKMLARQKRFLRAGWTEIPK